MSMMAPPPSATFAPSTPVPEFATLVAGPVRHLITTATGVGFAVGLHSDNIVMVVTSGIVWMGVVGWSIIQKLHAARAANAGSVRSAELKMAVKLTT